MPQGRLLPNNASSPAADWDVVVNPGAIATIAACTGRGLPHVDRLARHHGHLAHVMRLSVLDVVVVEVLNPHTHTATSTAAAAAAAASVAAARRIAACANATALKAAAANCLETSTAAFVATAIATTTAATLKSKVVAAA